MEDAEVVIAEVSSSRDSDLGTVGTNSTYQSTSPRPPTFSHERPGPTPTP